VFTWTVKGDAGWVGKGADGHVGGGGAHRNVGERLEEGAPEATVGKKKT